VHYWIIGRTNYPLKKIKLDLEQAGLKIIKTYRVFEFYGHRFFYWKNYNGPILINSYEIFKNPSHTNSKRIA